MIDIKDIVIPEIEDDVKVEFSDNQGTEAKPNVVWSEIVNFKDLLNVLIAFINKLIKFEF